MYSIQHYVITLVSDFRQVSGFLRVLPFLPLNITDHHDIAEILLKVAFSTITLTIFLLELAIRTKAERFETMINRNDTNGSLEKTPPKKVIYIKMIRKTPKDNDIHK